MICVGRLFSHYDDQSVENRQGFGNDLRLDTHGGVSSSIYYHFLNPFLSACYRYVLCFSTAVPTKEIINNCAATDVEGLQSD
jgi:hypothetical protein